MRHCIYCNVTFDNAMDIAQHLETVHGLPRSSAMATDQLPTESAFEGATEVYRLPILNALDLLRCWAMLKLTIDSIIHEKTREYPQKVQFVSEVSLFKTADDGEIKNQEFYAATKQRTVYSTGLEDDMYWNMVEQMLIQLYNSTQDGSGWIVRTICSLQVRFAAFVPARGSSFVDLPKQLKAMKCFLNIRNHNDHTCFLMCWTAAYHLKHGPCLLKDKTWRTPTDPDQYRSSNPLAKIPVGSYTLPMSIHDIDRFETANKTNVNVFRYNENKREVVPLRVSRKTFDFVVDLLLISDGEVFHYVLIKSLEAFLQKTRNVQFTGRTIVCRNCFHLCANNETLSRHQEVCLQNEAVPIDMPTEKKHEFDRWGARAFVPVVVYFDTECLLTRVQGCSNANNVSSTMKIEYHEPCSVAFAVVNRKVSHKKNDQGQTVRQWLNETTAPRIDLERGPDCMKQFVRALEKLAKDTYVAKRAFPMFVGTPEITKENATDCWICEVAMPLNDRVLDHCHFTGQFLGWAHNKCNLARRNYNFIPVVAHNLKGYDLHHVFLAFTELSPEHKISVIPATDEKYLSLTLSILVKTETTKNGKEYKTYEQLRFIDSLQFTMASLDKLAKTLPDSAFKMLDATFSNFPQTARMLLRCKGFYPYAYMDSFDRFEETALPSLNNWTNTLDGGEVISSNSNVGLRLPNFICFCCLDFH